jgi:lactoylglutathione lyase
MPITYRFDHLHILSTDPKAIARYYERMFGAKVIGSVQTDGKPRIDLDLNGLILFIFKVNAEDNLPASPPGRYLGLDHFGLIVDNLEETAAELKRKGAEFVLEPCSPRPGLKMAFIRGPENVRIELVERS